MNEASVGIEPSEAEKYLTELYKKAGAETVEQKIAALKSNLGSLWKGAVADDKEGLAVLERIVLVEEGLLEGTSA